MTPIDPAGIRRILIRVNNWIGDVVMISPAVRAIRAQYPEARVTILAKSWVLEALRGNPFYDELVEYDNEGAHRGLGGRLRLVKQLRLRRFDLAVLFQKAFEAAAFAFLAGARFRVGYRTDSRGPLLTHSLPLPPAGTHHAEIFLGLARALGCPIRDTAPFFYLDDETRQDAMALLSQAGLSGHVPVVALHPGASKPPRGWHADRFAELGRRLAAGSGARVVVLAGPGEGALADRIVSLLPKGSAFVPPRMLSIKGMGALLERCHLLVGNDSGPMHVAAALGVPTVALFGPGDPSRTAPTAPAERLAVISRRYPCSPCRQDFFRECPASPAGKPFCLEEVRVEEVEEAALRLLRAGRGPFV
ncbi:MAG TPA: lipopolysaccharide heptosyltransferase II [Candidatus Polarisedimenticolia bacterium]|nr:lipopolysaccharide heptosyltransferase II [Candidatus Polarisedimenticolia bacterium]